MTNLVQEMANFCVLDFEDLSQVGILNHDWYGESE